MPAYFQFAPPGRPEPIWLRLCCFVNTVAPVRCRLALRIEMKRVSHGGHGATEDFLSRRTKFVFIQFASKDLFAAAWLHRILRFFGVFMLEPYDPVIYPDS